MKYKLIAVIFAVAVLMLNHVISNQVLSGQLSLQTSIFSTELSYHGVFTGVLSEALNLGLFEQQILFIGIGSVIMLFLLISTFHYSDNLKRGIVFGGLLGGVFANLLYRYQHGYVLNTFNMRLLGVDFYFNVADIAIVFAILYMIVDLLLGAFSPTSKKYKIT